MQNFRTLGKRRKVTGGERERLFSHVWTEETLSFGQPVRKEATAERRK